MAPPRRRSTSLCLGLPHRGLELGGSRRGSGRLAEDRAEQLQVLAERLLPGAPLPGEDGAEVRGDQDPEALLPGHRVADICEQVLGERFEQLRRLGAVLGHAAAPISSSRSHSGSQMRRPSEASS